MRFLYSNIQTKINPDFFFLNITIPINVIGQNKKYPEKIEVFIHISGINCG